MFCVQRNVIAGNHRTINTMVLMTPRNSKSSPPLSAISAAKTRPGWRCWLRYLNRRYFDVRVSSITNCFLQLDSEYHTRALILLTQVNCQFVLPIIPKVTVSSFKSHVSQSGDQSGIDDQLTHRSIPLIMGIPLTCCLSSYHCPESH